MLDVGIAYIVCLLSFIVHSPTARFEVQKVFFGMPRKMICACLDQTSDDGTFR